MLRRLFLAMAVVAGLLVVAVSTLIAFRIALAEAVLSSRLAALGVPAARLTVESLDFRRIVVTDIALGTGAELRVDAVAVAYRPGALFGGRFDDLSIDGLRLRLDVSGAGPMLGSLQPLLAGGGGAAGPAAMPEVVSLSRGRIQAITPSGEVAAVISGRWRPAAGTAVLTLTDLELPHLTLDASRLDVAATENRIDATAVVRGGAGALDLDLSATVESWRDEPTLALTLEGRVAPGAWHVPPTPPLAQGVAAVSLALSGRLPPFQKLSTERGADWLIGADLRGRVNASLEDVAWRDRAQGISGTLDLAVTAADGRLGIEIADEGRIRIARTEPSWLDAIGVAAVAPQLRDATLTVVFPARDAPLHLRIRPTAGGTELAVSGAADVTGADAALAVRAAGALSLDEAFTVRRVTVSQADLSLRDLTVAGHRVAHLHLTGTGEGPPDDLEGTANVTAELGARRIDTLTLGDTALGIAADFRWSDRHLDIRQRGDGSASVASVALGAAARIARPLAILLTDGAATIDAALDSLAVSYAVTIRPDPVAVELPRPKAATVVLRADTGPIRLAGALGPAEPYHGRLHISRGQFEIPDEALSARAVSADVDLAPATGERLARFTVGRLVHTATPSYFAPLRIDGQVDQEEDALVLEAAARGVDGGLDLSIRGRHRLAAGRGSMQIGLPETVFREGDLQPAHISPLLRDIRDATGRFGGVVEFTWAVDGVQGKGALDLADISFTTDNVTVQGLKTTISLDGLFPLSARRDQRLTVQRIDPALPVENIAVRFRIEPAAAFRLHLKQATGRFAGGRLRMTDVVFDPSRPPHEFDVVVDDVDLGILLSLLKAEGLSGTGRLSGTIPVAVVDGSVIVTNGQLAAQGPGVIRVQSEAATAALRGTGEQVALMLQALEDFRYASLSATLDVEADGAADAMIRMRGNNPAVLEGYPFAFNIGLGGNVAKIVAALRQGAQLSSDLVRPQMR